MFRSLSRSTLANIESKNRTIHLGVINLESSSVGSENLVKDAIKKGKMVGIFAGFSLGCAKFI